MGIFSMSIDTLVTQDKKSPSGRFEPIDRTDHCNSFEVYHYTTGGIASIQNTNPLPRTKQHYRRIGKMPACTFKWEYFTNHTSWLPAGDDMIISSNSHACERIWRCPPPLHSFDCSSDRILCDRLLPVCQDRQLVQKSRRSFAAISV